VNEATERLLRARVRPTRGPVMRQRWDDLFFLHWTYDAAAIQARLPAGLMVDTFDGQAHLGVVGFRMNAVRPAFLPALPWISYFNELNVRTYVRDAAGEPGVWFFSLDCDRAPAVALARAGFGLPYEHATMSFGPGLAQSCRRRGEAETARYAWSAASAPQATTPGSLEFHLAERYSFFSVRGRHLVRGQVHHAPYQLSAAFATSWSDLPLRWDGFDVGGRAPDLAHCCQGVPIEAFSLVPAHA
jgi:uncharacterized protein YqjF (DUF2071 family)